MIRLGSINIVSFPLLLTLSACGVESIDGNTPSKPKSDDSKGDTIVPGTSEKSFDLSKCGFDLAKPSTLLLSKRMNLEPIKKTVDTSLLGGLFPSKTDVTFSSVLVIESSLTGNLVTANSSATPFVDRPEVTDTLTALRLSLDTKLLDLSSRSKIGEKYSQWSGLFCAVQPVLQLSTGTTKRIVLEFSQPLPFGVLAKSGLDRLKAEFSKKRTLSGIVAKVKQSTDASLAVGSTIEGNVSIEQVAPSSVPGAAGDFALKFIYDFGGPEKTTSLGIPSNSIWIFDTNAKTITAYQTQFGSDAPLIFRQ